MKQNNAKLNAVIDWLSNHRFELGIDPETMRYAFINMSCFRFKAYLEHCYGLEINDNARRRNYLIKMRKLCDYEGMEYFYRYVSCSMFIPYLNACLKLEAE